MECPLGEGLGEVLDFDEVHLVVEFAKVVVALVEYVGVLEYILAVVSEEFFGVVVDLELGLGVSIGAITVHFLIVVH